MYISLENLDHSGHLDPTYGNDLGTNSHYLCNSSDIPFSNTSYRLEEIYLFHLQVSSTICCRRANTADPLAALLSKPLKDFC